MILKMTGVKVTVIGEENVPDEPVLFIGNHRSFFDILLTYSRCKNLTGYVAKKEMEKVPLLSTWMHFVYCLFLDRENPKEGLKTILQAIDYVKKGISICIFPEGTRNKGEELTMLPFKEGAFKIATKTGCPIVPISMNNTAEIFENHFPKIKKTHVVLEYGTPIYPNELDKDVRNISEVMCRISWTRRFIKMLHSLTIRIAFSKARTGDWSYKPVTCPFFNVLIFLLLRIYKIALIHQCILVFLNVILRHIQILLLIVATLFRSCSRNLSLESNNEVTHLKYQIQYIL